LRHLAREAAEGDDEIVACRRRRWNLNTVASAILGTGKKFGVLPLGTLNHFAKDAKIPLDLESAVRVLVLGNAAEIDVGVVNERIFLNNASVGLLSGNRPPSQQGPGAV
jgi:hypothetical protein